jgi:hypothetical protein
MVKLTNLDKLHNLGWHHKIELNDGIKTVFNLQLKHASFVIELFLYDVKIYIFSYLYQIAQLGDDDDINVFVLILFSKYSS